MYLKDKEHGYPINGGPSKMDLMMALFDPHPNNDRQTFRVVTFKLDVSYGGSEEVHVIIEGLQRKNHKADYWSFKGYAPTSRHGMNCAVEGSFDSQGRHGVIKFILS